MRNRSMAPAWPPGGEWRVQAGVSSGAMQPTPEALDRLRAIGWPDDDTSRAALAAAQGARLARVVGQHRSAYDVATQADEIIKVQPPLPWTRPRCPPEQRAAVGDWVALDEAGKNILSFLPRRSILKRGAAGEHHRQQLIAANVDHVLVVVGLDQDFNPRRIERYLVVIRASDLNMQPVHDPVSSVVFQTSLANIDSVMVAGTWQKRGGQLLAGELSTQLARLRASGEKIVRAMSLSNA